VTSGASGGSPAPNRADHLRFVEIEGWTAVASTHHATYELELTDGRTLRTRISRPPGRSHTYGPALWAHILRDQLDVSEATFWRCVRDGQRPTRTAPLSDVPADAIPVEVAQLLIERVGLDERAVSRMTRTEAIARLGAFWTTGR